MSFPAASDRRDARRPAGLARTALPVALTLAFAGLGAAAHADATAATVPGTATFATPVSFADVASRVTPAVVAIIVTQQGAAAGHPRVDLSPLPEGTPFREFFRRHFPEGGERFELPRRQGQGSGFIIDAAGHVVTNDHVVQNAAEITLVLDDGTRHPARLVGRDPKTDLALLKVDLGKPLPFVTFGSADEVRVGDWVLAVGNPFGLGGSVSAGIVSARGRDIQAGPYDDYLQIDAPINQGNSGGPLFNAAGRVIGVNTAIYSPSGGNVGIGFAIPAATAEKVVIALKADGRVERGWLGLQIQSVTEELAAALGRQDQSGALVADVLPDSPASQAGLRVGDLILAVDQRPVKTVKDLPRMVADIAPGTRVMLTLERNGKEMQRALAVGAMPAEQIAARGPAPDLGEEPRLGLRLAPLTPEARRAEGLGEDARGVLVAEVEPGSAAAGAGIRRGARITQVGQNEVSTPEEAATRIRESLAKGGQGVLLRVEQEGEARFLVIKPGA